MQSGEDEKTYAGPDLEMDGRGQGVLMPRKFPEQIENRLCLDLQSEFDIVKSNRQQDFDDFENYVDLLDQKRTEKDYDWMSDIKIPEFVSQELTQASLDASLNFGTRDFAEVYLEDASDEAKKAAEAAKTLINKTLNRRDLFYYQKRIRAGVLARLSGVVHAECRWSKVSREIVVGHKLVDGDTDIHGEPVTDRDRQVPVLRPEPVRHKVVDTDQFELEVLDNRNVFYDDTYVYSLQQKPVIVRSEKSLERLIREKDQAGYFNLHLLREMKAPSETETSQETYNKYKNDAPQQKPTYKVFDILKRYGEAWCMVKKRDPETHLPVEVAPGINEDGKIDPKAELHELIQEYAKADGNLTLIAYHPTPYLDCRMRPYKPILRGICYLHPTEDGGFGDAKHSHDLQIGLDDTINMGNDRTKLATIPLFKVKKAAYDENQDQFYVEPGHYIPINQKDDLEEFKISDNIAGSMQQASFFINAMQQLNSTYPTTMGRLPVQASTTATAVQGAEQRTDNRQHFKALTWTNTWDADLYWFIMQMTFRFAEPETGLALMGKKVYDFKPHLDYFYLPVTQAIESEQSKQMKLRSNTAFMQMLQPYMQLFANQPGFVLFLSDILLDTAELMGKDVARYAGKLLNPAIPPMQPQAGQGGGQKMLSAPDMAAPSNQAGISQGAVQAGARAGAGGAYY